MQLTCRERLSRVWACWASARPCCPAALLRRVWGWAPLGACGSVEQEALDELSSTEATGRTEGRLFHPGAEPLRSSTPCRCVTVIVAAGRGGGLAGVAALLLRRFGGGDGRSRRARRRGAAAGRRCAAAARSLCRGLRLRRRLCPLQSVLLQSDRGSHGQLWRHWLGRRFHRFARLKAGGSAATREGEFDRFVPPARDLSLTARRRQRRGLGAAACPGSRVSTFRVNRLMRPGSLKKMLFLTRSPRT